MQLHTLTPSTPRVSSRRVGRGGKRGKTSGRGTKGQGARAGRKFRPELRDIIKRFPKRRGFGKNRGKTHVHYTDSVVLNVSDLQRLVPTEYTIVSPRSLAEMGIVSAGAVRTATDVVILGYGSLTKKLTVEHCRVSASAQQKIEAAGGSVVK